MYKYDYVKIKCQLTGWGFGRGSYYVTENYKKNIEDKAKEGWKYIGFISTKQRGSGYIQELDLIF